MNKHALLRRAGLHVTAGEMSGREAEVQQMQQRFEDRVDLQIYDSVGRDARPIGGGWERAEDVGVREELAED
jgi:hypothetical protein